MGGFHKSMVFFDKFVRNIKPNWLTTPNTTMEPLDALKQTLREKVPLGIDIALQSLKASIPLDVPKYNDALLLESRYRELNQNLLKGVLSDEDAQVEFNKLRESILTFIGDLQTDDFVKKPAEQAPGTAKKGKVLYRIPDQMQVQKEVKCLIRVAFDEAILMENLEKSSDDAIRDVRIAEVMGAEIVDPNEQKAFTIRTFSEVVQAIDEGAYTEWLFYVKPLLEGTYPLLVKISVVEIIDGKERKREVVLEETVQVVATEVEEKEGFSAANIPVNVTNTQAAGVPGTAGGAKKIGTSTAATILAGIVMAFFAIWYFVPQKSSPPSPPKTNGNGKGNNNKDTDNTVMIENRSAIKPDLTDTTALLNYLDSFPDGAHAQEVLDSLESQRFYFDCQQIGDSLIFNINGGKTPVQLSLLKNGKPILNRKYNQPGQIILSMKKDKITPGNYNVSVQDSSGLKRQQAITIQKIATLPIKATVNPNKKPADKVIKPNPNPTNPTKPETATAYADVSQRPIYQGCDQRNKKRAEACTERKITEYIRGNMSKMPEVKNITSTKRASVDFIIEKDGSVMVEKIKQDMDANFEKKIQQLVKSMPKFVPGKNAKGEVVRVKYTLPIRFEPQ